MDFPVLPSSRSWQRWTPVLQGLRLCNHSRLSWSYIRSWPWEQVFAIRPVRSSLVPIFPHRVFSHRHSPPVVSRVDRQERYTGSREVLLREFEASIESIQCLATPPQDFHPVYSTCLLAPPFDLLCHAYAQCLQWLLGLERYQIALYGAACAHPSVVRGLFLSFSGVLSDNLEPIATYHGTCGLRIHDLSFVFLIERMRAIAGWDPWMFDCTSCSSHRVAGPTTGPLLGQ